MLWAGLRSLTDVWGNTCERQTQQGFCLHHGVSGAKGITRLNVKTLYGSPTGFHGPVSGTTWFSKHFKAARPCRRAYTTSALLCVGLGTTFNFCLVVSSRLVCLHLKATYVLLHQWFCVVHHILLLTFARINSALPAAVFALHGAYINKIVLPYILVHL